MSDIEIVKSIIAANAEPPLEVESLDLKSPLLDIGIDSLKFLLIVIEIEQKIGRQVFDVDDVSSIYTVEDLVRLA